MISSKPKPILTTNATFYPYGYTIYKVLQNREDFSRPNYHKIDNKKGENKHQHGISKGAARKIKAALNMLVYIADDKPLYPNDKDCKLFFKVNTITLTLPAKQIHTDEQIKSLILDPFIKSCKYHFSMSNYFWKAEVQENGNIHFHLETDCYMDKDKLRHLWNHQLNRYGIIDAYRQNQIEKHKDGFYYNKNQYFLHYKTGLKTKIDYQTQKKAYDKAVANNWSDPNTTTIRAIVDVNNLAAYLIAYLSKKDLWKKEITKSERDDIERMEKENVPLGLIQSKHACCVKRSISGKIWDCSKKLKKTGLKVENVNIYQDELNYMLENEVEKVLYNEHCTVFIKKFAFQKMYPPALAELISNHYELMKYDCMNIAEHKNIIEYEKTIQANAITDSSHQPTTAKIKEFNRQRRLENLGTRNAKPIGQCKTQLQLRL